MYLFPETKMSEILNSFWSWRLNNSPEFASYCGMHDFDDRLDDLSEEAQKERQVLLFITQPSKRSSTAKNQATNLS